jgi:hypothetical protein
MDYRLSFPFRAVRNARFFCDPRVAEFARAWYFIRGMSFNFPGGPEPTRRLAVLILTVFFSALGVAAIGAACAWLVPPIDKTPAFDDRFTVLSGFLYAGQPAKSAAFETGCVAAPFLFLLSLRLARGMTVSLTEAALRRLIAAMLGLHVLFWAACVRPIFYLPHPPLFAPRWLLVPRLFPPPGPDWAWIVSLLAGLVLVFAAIPLPNRARARNLVMVPLLLLWILLAPTRLIAPSEITDQTQFTYHLNSVLDALSQVANGHHLLVDFPHIYGGYIEFLGPWLNLFPRTVGAPLLVLGIPSVLSVLFLLLTARVVLHRPLVLLLVGLALLGLTYVPILPDPVYGYNTARAFFPALGFLTAALFFRRGRPVYYVLTSLVAALAPVWNMDTGLVLWASWLLTLVVSAVAGRDWRRAAAHGGIQLAFFLAAAIGFVLYLRIVSGAWPDPGFLFYFQSLVVTAGYFCLPLVIPSAWSALVLLYLTGLAVAFITGLSGRFRPETSLVLFFSLFGIGTFSYYMGRSADTNLISICPPGVLLLGLFAWKVERWIRVERGPVIARWFLLPWAAMPLWWVFLLFAQLPLLLARGPAFVRDWNSTSATPFDAKIAAVTNWIQPREAGVYFISNHSGFYYYLTRTVRPLRIPGNIELLRTSDMDALLTAIRERRIPKLVVDRNFAAIDMYRPEVYRSLESAVRDNYQPVQTAVGGVLTLYVPRPVPH